MQILMLPPALHIGLSYLLQQHLSLLQRQKLSYRLKDFCRCALVWRLE
jgi:hypothetical protein